MLHVYVYLGMIFSHDKLPAKQSPPPEMEINPLNMVCGCPCGVVIKNLKNKRSQTHNPLIPWNAFVSVQLNILGDPRAFSYNCPLVQTHTKPLHSCSCPDPSLDSHKKPPLFSLSRPTSTPPLLSLSTLQAQLSGTFLQTLPDLVTPLKRHTLSPRSCPAMWSAPSERFGY